MGAYIIATENDFEELSRIAQLDPLAFEARRKAIIDHFIDSSPERQRALGIALQREIDAGRERAPDPGAALDAIMQMLDQQLVFLGEAMGLLNNEVKHFVRAMHAERNTPSDR